MHLIIASSSGETIYIEFSIHDSNIAGTILLNKLKSVKTALSRNVISGNFSKTLTKKCIENKFLEPSSVELAIDTDLFYSKPVVLEEWSFAPTTHPTSSPTNKPGDRNMKGDERTLGLTVAELIVISISVVLFVITCIACANLYFCASGESVSTLPASDTRAGEEIKSRHVGEEGHVIPWNRRASSQLANAAGEVEMI